METKAVSKQTTGKPSLFDRGWVERFFNAPIDEFFNMGKIMNMPAVNVSETSNEFKLCIAAPGLEKKDFHVEISEDLLTISAEKEKKEEKEEDHGRYNRREYNYSSWSRSFTLPENCDPTKIDAKYENGELKVSIPKREVKLTPNVKNIDVK